MLKWRSFKGVVIFSRVFFYVGKVIEHFKPVPRKKIYKSLYPVSLRVRHSIDAHHVLSLLYFPKLFLISVCLSNNITIFI